MTGTPPAPPRRVVLLSGDRHFGALYRETDGRPYPLTELTSSGINRVASAKRAEAGPNRLGDRWIGANVGRVSMDWETGSVALALADVHGVERRAVRLSLADVRAG